jgi:hypothetical protein
MPLAVDLRGPLGEFYERTSHIRQTLSAVEALAAGQDLHSDRPRADLGFVGWPTSNTANAMALVFLASSFEEFFRQEIMQCAASLGECYNTVSETTKISARNSYWNQCVERVRQIRIVGNSARNERYIDPDGVSEGRAILETVRGYALMDDVSVLDSRFFASHPRNFKPSVLNEIGSRLGISDIVGRAAEHLMIKRYFAETSKTDTARKLRSRLDGFYQIRNGIVHSLNAANGYGIEIVFDYIDLFERFSEALVVAITREIETWAVPNPKAAGG